MLNKVCDKITYPIPKLNGYNTEVLEWRDKFIPHSIMDAITYPDWDLSETMLVKRAPGNQVVLMTQS